MITNIIEPDTGSVEVGQTVKIGYFSQENEYMDQSLKVIDYIKNVAEYITTSEGSTSASQMLERFLFNSTMQYSVISKLSGGEKRRLYLLRVLMDAPNILILDEPTNDLDIQTLNILEDYLDNFDGIVLTVSHDRYFLDRVVDRIFAFEENGLIRQYEGGFSDYKDAIKDKVIANLETNNTQNSTGSSKASTIKQKDSKLKFSYNEQKEFDEIDHLIESLEDQIEKTDTKIAEASTDFIKLDELMKKKEGLEKELEQKMERWIYLNELAQEIEAEKEIK